MKQSIVFLTLIGLLLVNFNVYSQVEYFNEKNPRPEEVQLLPTMENAHRGTNFTLNEVKMAHEKELNSFVPVEVQKTFAQEKIRTLFEYYENVDQIDSWIGTNTTLGTNPDDWATETWSYLEPGTAPTGTILSGGYQSKKASGSSIGPKMIERTPYKKGDRGYTEDEEFLYLDLGKICSQTKYQGVKVLWISLGCGNHVFPFTPPALTDAPAQDVVEKRQQESSGGQGVWGSEWVVVNNYYTENYSYTTQMPPQQFGYAGMQYQWGFNYNPCWWSPAVPIFQNGCWGCNSYVPQTVINEGDTYIINEGDVINEGDIINEGDVINEGDIIIVNNNNNDPEVDEPDPDDDGGPVLPPNGDPVVDDDGGPVLGNNGPVLGDNGSNNDDDGGEGGNLGGSGMTTHDDGLTQTQTKTKTSSTAKNTSSFSDISEAKYWNASKDALLAQREDPNRNNGSSSSPSKYPTTSASSSGNGSANRTNTPSTSSKPNNWTNSSVPQSKPQQVASSSLVAERPRNNSDYKPQQWNGQNTAERNPVAASNQTTAKPSLNTAPQYSRRPQQSQTQNGVERNPTSSAKPNNSTVANPSKPSSSGRGNQTPSPVGTFQRNPSSGGSKPPVVAPAMGGGGGKNPTTTQPTTQGQKPSGGNVSPARMGGGGSAPAPAMGGGGGGRSGGGRR